MNSRWQILPKILSVSFVTYSVSFILFTSYFFFFYYFLDIALFVCKFSCSVFLKIYVLEHCRVCSYQWDFAVGCNICSNFMSYPKVRPLPALLPFHLCSLPVVNTCIQLLILSRCSQATSEQLLKKVDIL